MTRDRAESSPLVILLMRGGEFELRPDMLSAAGKRYALKDLIHARLIGDTAITVPRDAPAWPAVELTLRDRRLIVLTPSDPLDAWRMLDGIFRVAPHLRIPLPPMPDRGTWSGAASSIPGAGFRPPRNVAALDHVEPGSAEAVLAGIAHLSLFFAPLLLPLIVLIATRERRHYASRQAKQALVFQGIFALAMLMLITIWLAVAFRIIAANTEPGTTSSTPLGIVIALGVVSAFFLVTSIYVTLFAIYAAAQTFRGRPFSYPLLRRL